MQIAGKTALVTGGAVRIGHAPGPARQFRLDARGELAKALHALVRWMTAGSEALLAAPPEMLVALRAAADAGDVQRVKGITDALLAGWDG
jgi:hypothetical protein